MRNTLFKNIIFSIIPLFLLVSATEIVLRIVNFQYSDSPLEMRARLLLKEGYAPTFIHHENNSGSAVKYKKDSQQMWVPVKSFAEGFSKNKASREITRVISMGCSCTAGCVLKQEKNAEGGWSHLLSYPGMMGEYLKIMHPGEFEVLNAGVGGYSSYQGLQRLKHEALNYNPDIVTIFFGWNDHWVAGVPDKEARVRSASMTAVINFLEKFRTYQALHKLITKFEPNIDEEIKQRVTLGPRVALNDYLSNLNEMIDLIHAKGGNVVLITAPYDLSGFKPAAIYPGSKENLIRLHESYNDVVRKLSALKGTVLLDLSAEINADENLKRRVLLGDGIHFSEFGCDYVARRLTEVIVGMRDFLKLHQVKA